MELEEVSKDEKKNRAHTHSLFVNGGGCGFYRVTVFLPKK